MDGRLSEERRWRYAFASSVGTSHEKTGVPCQDATECRLLSSGKDGEVLAVLAADGAGSARFAEQGSSSACKHFLTKLEGFFVEGYGIEEITRAVVTHWLQTFQIELQSLADDASVSIREFACTILGCIVGSSNAVYFQVGDGVIVLLDSATEEYQWVFWPDRGEYANTTFFATDASAYEQLQFLASSEVPEEFAALTDGLQSIALHYESRTAHSPFFRGLFPPLRRLQPGHAIELSNHLKTYLGSSKVNSRTDDDKTLVLATRRFEVGADEG